MPKNEVATVASLTNLPTTARRTDLAKFSSGTEYLSRMQLIAVGSKYVAKGKIVGGNYGIPGSDDEIIDLGSTVDLLPLAVRDKALDTSGEKPIATFDCDSDLFQDIVEKSKIQNSGCLHGASFLVLERNTGRLLEFFLGNASGRYVSEKMDAFLAIDDARAGELGVEPREPIPVTFSSELREGKYTYWVPVLNECSTPFDTIPEMDVILKEVERFVTETAEDVPEVVATGSRNR